MSARRNSLRLALTGSLLAVLCAARVAAQAGTNADIITGIVTGPDSQPLRGATVEATSLETQVTRQRMTDERGRFTIVFPDGGGQFRIVAHYIGMARFDQTVRRPGDEDRIEVHIQMAALAVSLEPVAVTSQRGGGPATASGGSTAQSLSPEQMTRLPIDAGDLNAVAALAPGVLPIAATDSTTTAFSVAGQRSTANNVTLDGMSFGQGMVPQDALRSTRVITSTYDVTRGEFSGGLVTSTTRGGTNIPQGSFTSMLRDRSIAWGTATDSPFGAGTTQNQIGGGMGGPIVPNRLFVFAALQGRWRGQALPSLTSADPGALLRLGVSPDSAARFRALAAAAGAPATIVGLPSDRATDLTVGLIRLDWRVFDAQTLTLRLDGRDESQQPTRVNPLALPATGGTRSERGAGVLAALTSSFGASFVNELRGYVASSSKDVTPFVALPVARVNVTSQLPDGGQGIATLAFGGNGALPQHVLSRSVEMSDEVSWLIGNGGSTHRLKLGAYVNATHGEETEKPNQYGTFEFRSLAALATDSPATFTRTRVPVAQAGTAWNEALYLGDSWHISGGVRLTYGVRLETTRFAGAPPYERTVDSLFGVRTDRIPNDVQLLPRLGVTLGFRDESGSPTRYVRGGVGEFRSPPPSFLYTAALDAPGALSGATDLVCVGSAVPTPDWTRYGQDPSTIPSQCAGPAGTATSRPSVVVFDPAFTAPRVWRASLGLVQRVWERSWATVEFTYARGVSQYGFRDLNLVRQPAFTLPAEANRPVWLSPDSIVPATGALSSSGSRVHPEFGKVLAIRSDLQSDTKQLTLAFAGAGAHGTVVRLSYTLTWSRDQSSFACCVPPQGFASATTGSDPNALEWGTSDLERRHAFVGTVAYSLSSELEIGAIARLMSGIPFTPSVDADINGDGSRNDRAFIFDPRTTTDTALARSMAALLAGAPSGVRACLEPQLGRIAGRNSCTGPWQPSLDLQLNWRPQWFGSERRLTLSILTVNLLGGIDAWVHGAGHLQGWGSAGAPDRVLLYVQGFDRAALQYRYGVNGRFGTATTTGNGVVVPFQVGLQGRLTIGPPRPHRARADGPPS